MERIIIEYIFQCLKNELIKGNDYPLLIYLLRESISNNFPSEMEISSTEVSKHLGITKPTYYKSLDNLQFAGIISYNKQSGYGRGFRIRINFIHELSNNCDDSKSFRRIIHNYLPDIRESLFPFIFSHKKEENKDEFSGKESLLVRQFSGKESLSNGKESLSEIQSMGKESLPINSIMASKESLLVTVERYKEVLSNGKESLPETKNWYKVSLSFFSDAKYFDLMDLQDLIESSYGEIRRILSKISSSIYNNYIYNNIIIYILAIFDRFLFSGDLFFSVNKKISSENNSKKKSTKLLRKNFKLDEESIEMLPVSLKNRSEIVWGEEMNFVESYQEWLNYRRIKKSNPVTIDEATKDFKFLSLIDYPILSIQESMRKSANGIFEVKDKGTYSKKQNYDKKSSTVGTIKQFD